MTENDAPSNGRRDGTSISRRTYLAGAGAVVLGVAGLGTVTGQSANSDAQMITVSIENVSTSDTLQTTASGDQATQPVPLAPGAYAVHSRDEPIFSYDEPVRGNGLQALAEDGKPGTLAQHLSMRNTVVDSGVFATPVGKSGPGPLLPGDTYEFQFEVANGKPSHYLSFATMFIPSNDLFYAIGGETGTMVYDGNKPLAGNVTDMVGLWDAGTEINEEPGVGENQPQRQRGANVGLVERETVVPTDEIAGYEYPAVSDVLKVMVTPM